MAIIMIDSHFCSYIDNMEIASLHENPQLPYLTKTVLDQNREYQSIRSYVDTISLATTVADDAASHKDAI